MENPNIPILCKVVKGESGEVKLIELGEFRFSHNPVDLQKAMRDDLTINPNSRFVELPGYKVYQNNTF